MVTEEETKAILQDVLKMTTSEKAQNEESTISINAQGPESTTSESPNGLEKKKSKKLGM